MMASGFDRLAGTYSELWSETSVGQLQRKAVWRYAAKLFPAGSHILDLGCGTGDDARMFRDRGVRVTAMDASSEMVRIAQSSGVDARLSRFEDIAETDEYDGVWSNFGALNCTNALADLRLPLVRMVKPGGWMVICLMSRVCLWETFWYIRCGDLRRAARRWSGEATSSVAARVFYPTIPAVRRAFAPDFTLQESHGIGVAVPPSYVKGLSGSAIRRLARIDERIASLPLLRALGDHRLMIFRRGVAPC